jgi:hypothetical protein
MTLPNRRSEDKDGGISHSERHTLIDQRLSTVERRDVYVLLLLAINTMLTAGDLIPRIGPIIHTFASTALWLTSLRPF